MVTRDRLATLGDNLLDHGVCRTGVDSASVSGGADIVDDDFRPFSGEETSVGPPETTSGSGDDSHFALEKRHLRPGLVAVPSRIVQQALGGTLGPRRRRDKTNMSDPPKPSPPPPPRGAMTSRPSYADWQEEEASTRSTEKMASARPVAPTVRATLTVISGASAGRVHSIRDGVMLIGRGREAELRFEDAGVSRTHARVTYLEPGRYLLEDLESTNGTFVSGRRIERAELESGERINIGPHVTLSFAIVDSQAERMAHELYESAVRDTLTKAHNRRYLVERLGSEIAYARRHSTPLSLVLFDIDHFKRVNDAHGHLAGDAALREVAALVARMIRVEDVFARFGGEEFIVLTRGVELAGAGRFSERLRTAIEKLEIATEGVKVKVTISAGYASIAELAAPQRTAEGLIRLADERLYTAKEAGRNRTCGA
jgi:diguanylate cyclase (GGDEF)-like protein